LPEEHGVNLVELATVDFWVRWMQIVILDLTLAGDNALVIALAVRKLPPRQQWLGRIWGTAGAVGLRVAFIAIISQLLRVRLLQALGGLVLLWIATRLLAQEAEGGGDHQVRQGTTLIEAIWIIVVADVVMSLDNVLAISGAAHGDLTLVIFGVGLSIPLVVWGSGLLSRLMARFRWIVDLGAGILGWVAAEMILSDPVVVGWLGGHPSPIMQRSVQVALGVGVILFGRQWSRWRGRRGGSARPGPHA
jgi:YjbE family integral membrane protein